MAKASAQKAKGRTVADFKANHDRNVIIPNKIRAALEKMEAEHGAEHYEYENEFAKLAGVGGSDLNAHRDAFNDHIVTAAAAPGAKSRARLAWFATAKAAKKAKGE